METQDNLNKTKPNPAPWWHFLQLAINRQHSKQASADNYVEAESNTNTKFNLKGQQWHCNTGRAAQQWC